MKKIKLSEPLINYNEFDEVKKVLRSGWLTYGSKSLELESKIKKKFNLTNVIAVNSCTNGLHAALLACGIDEKDEVITSPFTFVSTINNLYHLKSKIVLADISLQDFNIDTTKIKDKINNRTKCILPVHYGGNPADILTIKKLCNKKKIKIVEDAATAMGAKIQNKFVGSLGTDASVFSLYGNKVITSGEGGVISVKSSALEKKIRTIIFCGMDRTAYKRSKNKINWKYDVVLPGFKYNMSDLQSSIALAQFNKINWIISHRKKIFNAYNKEFSDLLKNNIVKTITIPSSNSSSHYIYTLLLNTEKLKKNRDDLINYLKLNNIETTVHYIPAHKHKFYNKTFKKFNLENCNYVFDRILSLPMHNKLSKADIQYISFKVKNFIKKNIKKNFF